jgi:hypothetical protein
VKSIPYLLGVVGLVLAVSAASPAFAQDRRPLAQLKKGLLVWVEDESVNTTAHYFIQDGQIFKFLPQLKPLRNYCEVRLTKNLPFRSAFPALLSFANSGEVTLYNQAVGFSFTCLKRTSRTVWVVEDVREIFAPAMEVGAAD